MKRNLFVALPALLLLAGCGDLLGSRVHPAEILPDRVTYACGSWFPEEPAARRFFADIVTYEPAEITALGGRILHEFNIPLVRAEIDTHRVPELMRRGANQIIAVQDTADYELRFSIYPMRGNIEESMAAIEALGGRVELRTDYGWTHLVVHIHDSAVPALRALDIGNLGTDYGAVCLFGSAEG